MNHYLPYLVMMHDVFTSYRKGGARHLEELLKENKIPLLSDLHRNELPYEIKGAFEIFEDTLFLLISRIEVDEIERTLYTHLEHHKEYVNITGGPTFQSFNCLVGMMVAGLRGFIAGRSPYISVELARLAISPYLVGRPGRKELEDAVSAPDDFSVTYSGDGQYQSIENSEVLSRILALDAEKLNKLFEYLNNSTIATAFRGERARLFEFLILLPEIRRREIMGTASMFAPVRMRDVEKARSKVDKALSKVEVA